GVLNNIARRYRETTSDFIREKLENYMAQKACPTCDGYRLNEEALSVKINGQHIGEVTENSITEAKAFFESLDRKSTRLNSSHVSISYAVFCLKKKRYNI